MLSTKANQRIYEWRSTFASAAVAAINDFFLTSVAITTNERRAEFAKEKLKNFAFLFARGEDKAVSLIQVQLYTTDDPTEFPRDIPRSFHTSNIQLSSFCHPQFCQSSNVIEEAT